MRSHSHIVDTQARKLVPNIFPNEWEYREVTGRDYGIDMEIELFEKDNPTGQILLLQIKGRTKMFSNNKKHNRRTSSTVIISIPFWSFFSKGTVEQGLTVICPRLTASDIITLNVRNTEFA